MRGALRGVIFDVDGTLIDSNDAHARAWVDVGRELGYSLELAHVRDMIGMGGDKLMPALVGVRAESEEGKAIGARRWEIFSERYLPGLRPFPRVRELLTRMRDGGLELFVATSASEQELGALLRAARVDDLMSATASKKDAEHSKPDPDVIDAAIEQSGYKADALVMVGDTPYDVEAASRARVPCIAFRSGGWSDDRLAGAVLIYDGAWAMLDHYDDFERLF